MGKLKKLTQCEDDLRVSSRRKQALIDKLLNHFTYLSRTGHSVVKHPRATQFNKHSSCKEEEGVGASNCLEAMCIYSPRPIFKINKPSYILVSADKKTPLHEQGL